MPSIELYDPSAFADGWHDVRAPGGYEWWYFDAEDAAADTQLVAIFMEGFVFHPGYLRAYQRYVKHPTKTAPPTAGDFPCVYLCIYRGGQIWRQFFTQFRRDQFRASRGKCDVEIGPNTLRADADGGYQLFLQGAPWTLTARGPQTRVGESLVAELYFEAKPAIAEPVERTFLSREMTGGRHAWTVAAPRCEVTGSIRHGDRDESNGELIAFDNARGYHDHNFGTAPIGDGLARWTWGRAMFESGRTITFHHAEPTDTRRPDETHVVEATSGGLVDRALTSVAADWSGVCRPAMFLQYPRTLDFGDVLKLSEPRVVDPSPFYLRLQFVADSFGERSTAFCEIAYPHRLRWPLLGRMIEMSFDKRETRSSTRS